MLSPDTKLSFAPHHYHHKPKQGSYRQNYIFLLLAWRSGPTACIQQNLPFRGFTGPYLYGNLKQLPGNELFEFFSQSSADRECLHLFAETHYKETETTTAEHKKLGGQSKFCRKSRLNSFCNCQNTLMPCISENRKSSSHQGFSEGTLDSRIKWRTKGHIAQNTFSLWTIVASGSTISPLIRMSSLTRSLSLYLSRANDYCCVSSSTRIRSSWG